jgi:hypothetical protein
MSRSHDQDPTGSSGGEHGGRMSIRGRGLDALFSGPAASGQTSGGAAGSVPTSGQTINTDLAALLDNEVAAISHGTTTHRASDAFPGDDALDGIDVPPPGNQPLDTGGNQSIDMGGSNPGGDFQTASDGTLNVSPGPIPQPLPQPQPVPQPVPQPQAKPQPAPEPIPEPQPQTDSQLIPRPLSPVKPEQPLPVTTRIGAIVMEAGTTSTQAGQVTAVAIPTGPGQPIGLIPMPSPRQLSDEQRLAILGRLDQDWLKTLHKQIDDLYRLVASEFSSPAELAEQMLSMLHDARQTLIETPEEYVAAEYRTLEVKTMMERMRYGRKSANRLGPRILGYEVGWMLLLLLGMALAGPLTGMIARFGSITGPTATNVTAFWNAMMWGGIGGVVGGLYHLWWHVSEEQDFDPQYMMWYLIQPVMGLVLGGILFLIIAGGFLVVQVDLTNPNAGTAAHLIPYLLAVLGGFQQNFVYEQLNRLIKLFTPAATDSTAGSKTGGSGG